MSESVYRRATIRFALTAVSPLAIGSADSESVIPKGDKHAELCSVVRGHDGRPCLPGSTLRGWLRSRMSEADANRLFGAHVSEKTSAGKIDVSSAHLPVDCRDLTHSRYQHARDTLTGAVADHLLFKREFVPANAVFDAALHCHDIDTTDLAVLVSALQSARGQLDAAVGSAKQSGHGRVKVEVCGIAVADDAQIKAWLAGSGDMMRTEAVPALSTAEPEGSPCEWKMQLCPRSAFLCEDADATLTEEKRLGFLSKQPLRDGDTAVIPGASLKGALRHEALRIVQSQLARLVDQPPDPRSLTEQAQLAVAAVFGSSECTGHMAVTDFRSTGAVNVIPRQFNAIDRFTGGASDQRLYRADVVTCGPLQGSIAWRASRPPDIEDSALRFLAALAVRECWFGALWLGWGTRRGLGEMALRTRGADASFDAWLSAFLSDLDAAETAFNTWMNTLAVSVRPQQETVAL